MNIELKDLKKLMIENLDPMAVKEYRPLISKIKSLDDAKKLLSRMGLGQSDIESFFRGRV
jgi:hypothetical protein